MNEENRPSIIIKTPAIKEIMMAELYLFLSYH